MTYPAIRSLALPGTDQQAAWIKHLGNPPLFQAFQVTTPTSVPNAAWTACAWDSVPLDSAAGYAAGTPTRYTVRAPGWYYVTANVAWVLSAAGTVRGVSIGKNGVSGQAPLLFRVPPVGLDTYTCGVAGYMSLAVGDYLEVFAYQDVGAALSTQVGFTLLTAKWEGPQ